MLKGKKGLYILLPVVVFIWGAILFQVLDAFSGEDPVDSDITAISFTTIKTKERDTFTIGEVDRDPFLGTMYRPKKVINKNPKPRVKKPEITWPTIRYKGLVSAQNNSSAIFLVEINGADQLMKINDSFSEAKLIKGSSSSIKLRYKGKTKQFQILN
ncbi:hypothetical protein [uncultured Aquimarina sp.]|uniref:hypothetical protein n=1 Tax=uncultured Aquimarina sp. TaxID=575652 RepID=UPI002601B957|nr:hypothetical protein [uncultured Aquimarina sp.]